MLMIYKYTVKIDGAIQTHYVRASTSDRAQELLAQHLNVSKDIIKHNPKNIPFKVREKILAGESEEQPDGSIRHYKISVDEAKTGVRTSTKPVDIIPTEQSSDSSKITETIQEIKPKTRSALYSELR